MSVGCTFSLLVGLLGRPPKAHRIDRPRKFPHLRTLYGKDLMSVLIPTEGEDFMIRIHKRLTTSPLLDWVNTYEMEAGSTTSLASLQNLALLLYQMEQSLHQTDVEFFKYVISTWVPDGAPYNPTSFVAVTLVGVFGLNAATPGMSLHNCLQVNRSVVGGRQGKIFYRRVVGEGDVSSPNGELVLAPASKAAYQGFIDAEEAGDLADYLAGGATTVGKLVMKSALSTRQIGGFLVDTAKVVKYNHRYFDRA